MPMRILAIDHGEARVGCAISDPSGTLARPLDVVEPPDAGAVARLAAENGAELVVVGLPVTLRGERGPQAEAALEFHDALAGVLDVPVETYDERLTTRMAGETARRGARAPADALAAAHLLESYLEARVGGAGGEAGRAGGEAGRAGEEADRAGGRR